MEDPFAIEEVLPPVPLPPASTVKPILVLDNYTIPTVESPKGGYSPRGPNNQFNTNSPLTPGSSRSRRNEKKKVSFSADTPTPEDNNLALSITKHIYTKDVGYTQYTVEFLYRGIAWSIPKRYRDFEELNRKLILENEIHNIDLPILPKKRWFEKQRWLNRFDESYGIKRRHDLQVYMRCLAKMQIIRENSPAFRDFIAMPPEAAKIQREEFQRQASGEISPPKDRKLEYRDSMLEVDLNLEFDDEGNAICPVDPYQERSHEIEDREHQIYSIGEEEHEHEHDHDRDLSPIPPEEGETDSDDEKGGEEGNEPAMESEPVGGEADNEQQREEQRSRLQAVDGRQDVDRGADGVDSSSASTAPSIAAATTSSPKGSAHSHDMTLKLQSLHSHY